MKPFTILEGIVAPMDRANVDTDLIIPKQFLKSIKRSGFGPNLFDELRYLDEGQPGQDCSQRPLNPDFPLNQPRYQGAAILLARENFGCGSSREHAPWALDGAGFRAIIAMGFADIFRMNCSKSGIVCAELDETTVRSILDRIAEDPSVEVTVDLPGQTVRVSHDDPGKVIEAHFDIDPHTKHCLVNGLDDIALTLEHEDAITEYEKTRPAFKARIPVG